MGAEVFAERMVGILKDRIDGLLTTLQRQLRQLASQVEPVEAAYRHQRANMGSSSSRGKSGGGSSGSVEPYPGFESVSSSRSAITDMETTQQAMAELFRSLASASPIVVHRQVLNLRDLLKARLVAFLQDVFVASSSNKSLEPPSVLLNTFSSATTCLQVTSEFQRNNHARIEAHVNVGVSSLFSRVLPTLW